jgi:ElaB/YqjD/DUF883 family membrane-anchored ribosome-binding protein
MNEYERNLEGVPEPRPGQAESGSGKTTKEIEQNIEATRERMSRDIDELGEKLSPDNLKRQAREAIAGKAQDVVNNVGEQARETGNRVFDFIRENPLPVVAMGLGAVWLFQQRGRSEVSGDRMARFAYTGPDRRASRLGRGITHRVAQRAEDLREAVGEVVSGTTQRVSDVAAQAGEKAGELGRQARHKAQELGTRGREQTRRVRSGLDRFMQENPLAAVGGAAILGLAIGLLVPATEKENRLMGPSRDELMDRAQSTARRVKDAATEAGQQVSEVAREEISDRAPEVKATLKDAAEAIGAKVKESVAEVKEEAKEAAKGRSGQRGRGNA